MRRERGARVRDTRKDPAETAVPVAPRDERGDIERERGRVQERVDGPDPPGVVLEVAPVVQAGQRGRDGPEDPDGERVVGSFGADEIEHERSCPRAERHVGQRRMERIAEPDPVEHVPYRLRHGTHGLLHRLGDLVERLREVRKLLGEAEIRHVALVPDRPVPETLTLAPCGSRS